MCLLYTYGLMSLNEFGALYKSDAVVRNVCGDYEIAPGAWLTHRR